MQRDAKVSQVGWFGDVCDERIILFLMISLDQIGAMNLERKIEEEIS